MSEAKAIHTATVTAIVMASASSAGIRACNQDCKGQTRAMMNKASAKGANTSAAWEAATQIMTAAIIPTETVRAESRAIKKIPGSAEVLCEDAGACARTASTCTGGAFLGSERYLAKLSCALVGVSGCRGKSRRRRDQTALGRQGVSGGFRRRLSGSRAAGGRPVHEPSRADRAHAAALMRFAGLSSPALVSELTSSESQT